MSGALLSVVVQSPRRPVRDMLAAHFAAQLDVNLIGRTDQWADLIALCKLRRPDAVVADVGARIGDTVGWVKLLRARCPGVHVVLVYDQLTEAEIGEAREAGAGTFVPYSHGVDGLSRSLRRLGVAHQPVRNRLSGRELEILALMNAGHTVPQMATLLNLSPHTVENYKRHLYAKLEVGSQAQAVSRAVSLGLIDRPAPRRVSVGGGGGDGARLVVVGGAPGMHLDRVHRQVLAVRSGLAVERAPARVSSQDRIRWRGHRVITLLVDPRDDDWALVTLLEAPCVVVSSTPLDPAAVTRLTQRGASAVVSLGKVDQHLGHVLALAADGYTVVQVAPRQAPLRPPGRRGDRRTSDPPKLSAREQDILRSVARGHTVRQTALSLGIATKTVENLQAHLFSKLGVHSRVAALNVAQVLGLVQLAPNDPQAVPARVAPGAVEVSSASGRGGTPAVGG